MVVSRACKYTTAMPRRSHFSLRAIPRRRLGAVLFLGGILTAYCGLTTSALIEGWILMMDPWINVADVSPAYRVISLLSFWGGIVAGIALAIAGLWLTLKTMMHATRRPQFSLKTLLWFPAVVAAFAWAWANMEPMRYEERAKFLIAIGSILGLFILMLPVMSRESRRKRRRREKSAQK